MPARTIVKGGKVVDVSASALRDVDVVVAGNRIIAIDTNVAPGEDDLVLDASGLVVCPGFIDVHVHGEHAVWSHGCLEPALAQGITSLILGQDGCSWAPGDGKTVAFMRDYFGAVNGRPPASSGDGISVAELLQVFDQRAQNVAYLVPHGNLRHLVAPGSVDPLRGDSLRLATRHLEAALADGAIGMSSGLDYMPSRFADTYEMASLCAPLQSSGYVYVSHMRNAGRQLTAALDELLAVGAMSRAKVHASHLRGPWSRVEPAMTRAVEQGIDVTYDSYPYSASSSILGMFILPDEMQFPDVERTLAGLEDSHAVDHLSSLATFSVDHLSKFTLSHVGGPRYQSLEGFPLVEAAKQSGKSTTEFVLDLLLDSRLEVAVIYQGSTASDDDIISAALDTRHCACSDGIYRGSHPHPRSYAAFTTFLSIYLQHGGGWLQAVEHLSTHAARRFGLSRRGEIKVGYYADIAVFDAAGLAVRATFDQPRQMSTGLQFALVNGELAWSSGAWTGSMSGRILSI